MQPTRPRSNNPTTDPEAVQAMTPPSVGLAARFGGGSSAAAAIKHEAAEGVVGMSRCQLLLDCENSESIRLDSGLASKPKTNQQPLSSPSLAGILDAGAPQYEVSFAAHWAR